MEIRQQQKMEQHLALTQEMLTSLAILELSGTELLDYLKEEAQVNPALDSDQVMREIDKITGQLTPDRIAPYLDRNPSPGAPNASELDPQAQLSAPQTFRDYLEEQLQWLSGPPQILSLARLIVDSLNENGYLGAADEANLAERPDFAEALSMVQSLEPAGVGARSLAESLILQLRGRGIRNPDIETILSDDLTELADENFDLLAIKYPGVDLAELLGLIRTLDPRPGAAFADSAPPIYVLPDLTFAVVGEAIQVSLNREMIPEISISSDYIRLLDQLEGEEKQLSRQYVRRLMGIIDAIEKRNATLLRIGQGIALRQKDYLLGRSAQPMALTMSDLARTLELSVSTISRAARDKYVQFHQEVLPMRIFFNRGGARDGSNTSRSYIKALIRQLIQAESSGKPLSDQTITHLLLQRGIRISRRTVAKYRGELNLAGRHLRHKE